MKREYTIRRESRPAALPPIRIVMPDGTFISRVYDGTEPTETEHADDGVYAS